MRRTPLMAPSGSVSTTLGTDWAWSLTKYECGCVVGVMCSTQHTDIHGHFPGDDAGGWRQHTLYHVRKLLSVQTSTLGRRGTFI